MSETIKVVVIDDSAFMRKSLTLMLESDPAIKVIGTAGDGKEGIEKVAHLKPDLVTLDIEMPRMDGLTTLKIIMKEMPLPVIMVSSLSVEGARVTVNALSEGAVDFIPKNLSTTSLDIMKIKQEIIEKVKRIVKKNANKSAPQISRVVDRKSRISKLFEENKKYGIFKHKKEFDAVLIGISTGGPYALLQMIPTLPANFPLGIAIVQHMPAHFTKSLADRLDQISALKVKEAENNESFEKGVVYIAPGGKHLTFQPNDNHINLNISSESSDTLYCPSVDLMMNSAVNTFENSLIGVIMTGMGKDGVKGLNAIKNKNGHILAQDEESCVVFGMPKEAILKNLVDEILPLSKISNSLVALVN